MSTVWGWAARWDWTMTPLNARLLARVRENPGVAGIQPYPYGCLRTRTGSNLQYSLLLRVVPAQGQLRNEDIFTTALESSSWAAALCASYTLPIKILQRAFQGLEVCSPPHPRPGVKPSLTDALQRYSPAAGPIDRCDSNSQQSCRSLFCQGSTLW